MKGSETANGSVSFGLIKHKVWFASMTGSFYAKSGLDMHGPYGTAAEARKACAEIEAKETDHER